jgi:hypothetical protein
MEVNSWTDYNMNWNDPDPSKPEYFLALYNAVNERFRIIDKSPDFVLPLQNNTWNTAHLNSLR